MYQGVAAAKINLSLAVEGRRADGYHLLQSVMQSISLCDIVEVERARELVVESDCPQLSAGADNLAWRAAELLLREFAITEGVRIRLEKHIPLGGGLAGGSADAAQALLGVNELFSLGLSSEELAERALRLGADVPFCIYGGTRLARGVGEKLTKLPLCPELRLVLVYPGFAADTPAVYRQYDQLPKAQAEPNAVETTEATLRALAAGDPAQIRASLHNALEPAAFALFPKLAAVKAELEGLGLAALLCGSGAAVFGVAADKKRAAMAAEQLRGKYPFVCTATTRSQD